MDSNTIIDKVVAVIDGEEKTVKLSQVWVDKQYTLEEYLRKTDGEIAQLKIAVSKYEAEQERQAAQIADIFAIIEE